MEIEKKIEPSLEAMDKMQLSAEFTFLHQEHHLNGREFKLSKGENCFKFDTTSTIIKGLQTHLELAFQRSEEYELRCDSGSVFIQGKDIWLNILSYSESDLKILSGSIYALSNKKNVDKIQHLYRRFVLPLESEKVGLSDFQKQPITFRYKNKKTYSFYFPITINDTLFHFYELKHNEKTLLIIDSTSQIEEKEFQKICFNILLAFAFIKGSLFHDECFILGYAIDEMELPQEVNYFSMRASIKTNQPTFTTNIYSIYSDIIDKYEKDEERKEIMNKLYENIHDYSFESFSKLSELLVNEEKVQRALILFIQGHISSLEIRLPLYFVALEAFTAYIIENVKDTKGNLNPIKDKKIAQEIISMIIRNIELFIKEKELSKEDIDIEILKRKMDSFNSPPNADKLSEPFSLFGYTLTDEQFQILKKRNSYLHGSFVKYVDDERVFKEALFIGLRVHFLVAFLILKATGFNGKIINYCSLWESMTEIVVNEERMILI